MMKLFTISLLVIAIAVPLSAQHGQSGFSLNGVTLSTPAEVSVGRDDNFLVQRATVSEQLLISSLGAGVLPGAPNIRPTPLSDTVYILKPPTIAYMADSKRRELDFNYQPEFELYQFNRDQNAWNNNADVSFTQLLSRRWSAFLGDAYRTSHDPSRALQNPLLLLPRSQYRENSFRASLSFEQSQRTSYSLRYDNTRMAFGEYDALQRSVLDNISSGVSLMYSRMLARNHRIRVTYSVFNAQPWNHSRVGDNHVSTDFVAFTHPAQSVVGEYRFTVNPKTVFEFSGGGIKTSLGTDATFSAFGDRRVGDAVWVGGGFSRGLTFYATGSASLPSGLATTSFYDVTTIRIKGQPAQKIGIQGNVTIARSAYGTVVNGNDTVMGRSRIDYRLNPHTIAFLSFEVYNQNQNAFVQTPLSRTRLFIGLDYSFADASVQRTSRLNRDADNVALTEKGRLRTKPD